MERNLHQFSKSFFPRLIILITILVNVFFLYFIYKNVLKVFSSSKESIILKKEVITSQLKIDLFKKIIERLENKKNIEEESLENFKDPFSFSGKIEIK